MSAQLQKLLLTIFYIVCLMGLLAPVALGASNTTTSNHTNTSTTPTPSATADESNVGATHLTSTVALFGALVAAAVFTI